MAGCPARAARLSTVGRKGFRAELSLIWLRRRGWREGEYRLGLGFGLGLGLGGREGWLGVPFEACFFLIYMIHITVNIIDFFLGRGGLASSLFSARCALSPHLVSLFCQ